MTMTMLTPHFSLEEMQRSGTASQLDIDNTATQEAIDNLRQLCINVLEPLRLRYGRIIITSGYRCKKLNEAVGGVPNSQHTTGEAADIHCSSIEQAKLYMDFIKDNLTYDQLILERYISNGCYWIHVSYVSASQTRKNRKQFIVLATINKRPAIKQNTDHDPSTETTTY